MSANTPRRLTSEAEVEQLLRDSANCDISVFGAPPHGLIQRAMAAIRVDEPCEERVPIVRVQAQRSTALIVLSLAAAGLFLAALPRQRILHGTHAVNNGSRPISQGSQMDNQTVVHVDQGQSVSSQPIDDGVVHSSSVEVGRVSIAAPRIHRWRTISRRAPKAIWTTTVVSESEQGIILPVVARAANNENDSEGQDQTGVAVVPLQSGLTYTDYEGPGPQ
jgi:hypothetical protein